MSVTSSKNAIEPFFASNGPTNGTSSDATNGTSIGATNGKSIGATNGTSIGPTNGATVGAGLVPARKNSPIL